MTERIKCIACDSMVLLSTAERNHGFCGVCRRVAEHLAYHEEIGSFEKEWKEFLSGTNAKFFKKETSKKKFIEFVKSLVDDNLKEQLKIPENEKNIKYCFLRFSEGYKDKLIGEYDQESKYNAYDLMECKQLDKAWACPSVTFKCKKNEIPNFPPLAAPFNIASKSLLENIHMFKNNSVQLIPVTVQATDGISNKYFAINVLASHEIWNLKNSTWEGLEEGDENPLFMRNMMVIDNLHAEEHIFRNSQYSPLIVYSKDIAKIIVELSSIPMELESINKWSN